MNLLRYLLVFYCIFAAEISHSTIDATTTSLKHPVFLEHGHVIRKRETGQQIRITPHYDQQSMSFLTTEKQDYLENIIMSNVIEYFSQLLSVKPLGQEVPIRVARGCNGTATTVKFASTQTLAP